MPRKTSARYKELLEYQKEYYYRNREKILAHQAEMRRQQKEHTTQKPKPRTKEEFFQFWNDELKASLERNEFEEDWMPFAVKMQIEHNTRQIELLNGEKEEGKGDKEN